MPATSFRSGYLALDTLGNMPCYACMSAGIGLSLHIDSDCWVQILLSAATVHSSPIKNYTDYASLAAADAQGRLRLSQDKLNSMARVMLCSHVPYLLQV